MDCHNAADAGSDNNDKEDVAETEESLGCNPVTSDFPKISMTNVNRDGVTRNNDRGTSTGVEKEKGGWKEDGNGEVEEGEVEWEEKRKEKRKEGMMYMDMEERGLGNREEGMEGEERDEKKGRTNSKAEKGKGVEQAGERNDDCLRDGGGHEDEEEDDTGKTDGETVAPSDAVDQEMTSRKRRPRVCGAETETKHKASACKSTTLKFIDPTRNGKCCSATPTADAAVDADVGAAVAVTAIAADVCTVAVIAATGAAATDFASAGSAATTVAADAPVANVVDDTGSSNDDSDPATVTEKVKRTFSNAGHESVNSCHRSLVPIQNKLNRKRNHMSRDSVIDGKRYRSNVLDGKIETKLDSKTAEDVICHKVIRQVNQSSTDVQIKAELVDNTDSPKTKNVYFPLTTATTTERSFLESDLAPSNGFGESHVNKLMSFVDSLESLEQSVKLANGMTTFTYSHTPGVSSSYSPNHVTSAYSPDRGVTSLYSPALGADSQPSVTSSNSSSTNRAAPDVLYKPYKPSSGTVNRLKRRIVQVLPRLSPQPPMPPQVEQPLDLSIRGRERASNKPLQIIDFNNASVHGSPLDGLQARFGEKSTMFATTITTSSTTRGVTAQSSPAGGAKRRWTAGSSVAALPPNMNWSFASSLASLQSQIESAILSDPIIKASMLMRHTAVNGAVSPDRRTRIGEEKDAIVDVVSALNLPLSRARRTRVSDNSSRYSHRHSKHEKQNQVKLCSSSTPSPLKPGERDKITSLSHSRQSPESTSLSPQLEKTRKSAVKTGCDSDRVTTANETDNNNIDRNRLTSLSCSCSRQFATLYALTVHMEETGHRPSHVIPSSAEEFPKLVRGQDLWLTVGRQQAERTLRCIQCRESFKSLPELTVHMVKSRHYVDIVCREEAAENGAGMRCESELATTSGLGVSNESERRHLGRHLDRYSDRHLSRHVDNERRSEKRSRNKEIRKSSRTVDDECNGLDMYKRNKTAVDKDDDASTVSSHSSESRHSALRLRDEDSESSRNSSSPDMRGRNDRKSVDSNSCSSDAEQLQNRSNRMSSLNGDHSKMAAECKSECEDEENEAAIHQSDDESLRATLFARETLMDSEDSVKNLSEGKKAVISNQMEQQYQDKSACDLAASLDTHRKKKTTVKAEKDADNDDVDSRAKKACDGSKVFFELIDPPANIVDSSSTLKAMESFIERSFFPSKKPDSSISPYLFLQSDNGGGIGTGYLHCARKPTMAPHKLDNVAHNLSATHQKISPPSMLWSSRINSENSGQSGDLASTRVNYSAAAKPVKKSKLQMSNETLINDGLLIIKPRINEGSKCSSTIDTKRSTGKRFHENSLSSDVQQRREQKQQQQRERKSVHVKPSSTSKSCKTFACEQNSVDVVDETMTIVSDNKVEVDGSAAVNGGVSKASVQSSYTSATLEYLQTLVDEAPALKTNQTRCDNKQSLLSATDASAKLQSIKT